MENVKKLLKALCEQEGYKYGETEEGCPMVTVYGDESTDAIVGLVAGLGIKTALDTTRADYNDLYNYMFDFGFALCHACQDGRSVIFPEAKSQG